MRFEFWNAWMHSKLSLEKKSMSMNLGSIMEREEKRFVYRIRCSSDENSKEEEMEEGIYVSWASKCRWLRLEEPLCFFYGSSIWESYLKFQSVKVIENEKRILGFVGLDLDKKWARYDRNMNWERGFARGMKSCRFLILKSEYIGARTCCNRLQHLVIDYTLPDCL